jgi:hypothetical protein
LPPGFSPWIEQKVLPALAKIFLPEFQPGKTIHTGAAIILFAPCQLEKTKLCRRHLPSGVPVILISKNFCLTSKLLFSK